MCLLEPSDGSHQVELHIVRQAGTDTIRIQFAGTESLGFDKHLMGVLIGEPNHLVLNRRTVSWTDTFDLTCIERGPIEIGTDNFVGSLIGMGNETGYLLGMICCRRQIRHHRSGDIARLLLQIAEIDSIAIDPWWCPCFESVHRKWHLSQSRRPVHWMAHHRHDRLTACPCRYESCRPEKCRQ